MKKLLAVLLALVMLVSLAACADNTDKDNPSSDAPANSDNPSMKANVNKKIAMIMQQGGLGDQGFNDTAYAGLMTCKEKYDLDVNAVECTDTTQGETLIRELCEAGYGLIINLEAGISGNMYTVARDYLEGKPLKQVCNTVDAAMDAGINLLDCFMSNPDIRSDLGTALKGKRDKMYIQGHFRSIWKNGQYGRTMDVKVVQAFFEDLLRRMQTDYIDLGMIHMIDNAQEYEEIFSGPILEYALELKQKGLIRALGVSCHNPVQALRAAKTGLIDLMLFSVNPAYDVLNENAERPRKLNNRFFDSMQELGGINPVREELYRYCEMHGVGITVMKSLAAGALLSDKTSPFGRAMTVQQCMHYALSRPGVASVLVGMQSPEQVADCLRYETMTPEELDYSFLFAAEPKFSMQGRCMYCNHCLPCAKHINIAQLSKYLDMALLDGVTPTLQGHYDALEHHAGECIGCGRCETQCPFNVPIMQRMKQAAELFGK